MIGSFRPSRRRGEGRSFAIHPLFAVLSGLLPLTTLAVLSGPAKAATDGVVVENGIVGYVKGRILVKARPGLSGAALDKELKVHGGTRVGHIKAIDVHIVELPGNANEQAIAKLLAKNPKFKYAELDLVVKPSLSTNDPYIASAWHLAKIGAQAAWDSSTGTGVTIAVLDTGVNGAHPDLAANLVPGWNVFDNNNNTADVYGHGTAVAGLAAAAGNNAAGAAGLAWSAKIMPVRVSAPDGLASYSAMANGITWAADNGAKVANLSYQTVAGSATVSNAAAYLRSKGGVLIVCAGNSGVQEPYAADSNLTAVSATTSADAMATFSSFGTFVDIAAPGAGVYLTTSSGGYSTGSGTSFASPIVAGVYALMMTANPRLSPANLDQAIFSTAMDLGATGRDSYYGAGRVDAARAVAAAKSMVASDTTAPSVVIGAPSAGATIAGTVNVDVSATDAGGVGQVDLYANNKLVATDIGAPYQFSLDTSALADGPLTLVAKAKDVSGNMGTSPSVVLTVANDTIAPKATITSPTGGSVVTGTVNVTGSATDNKSVASVSLLINGKEVAVSYGSTISYAWSPTVATAKKGARKTTTTTSTSATITLRAKDAAGNVGSASVTVQTQ